MILICCIYICFVYVVVVAKIKLCNYFHIEGNLIDREKYVKKINLI